MEVNRGTGFLPVLFRPSLPVPLGESGTGRPGEPSGRPADDHGTGPDAREDRGRVLPGVPRRAGHARVPPGIRELEQVQAMTGQEVMRRGGRLDLYA
ncbi:MAG: hypothetical protein JJU06_21835 [Ectothiorhodospiraceae bacterium]|nr:hypothetical protein [Ectothiorhodospiraceae bacterium]MCH8504751.1 hypothetical protein [Ectothiorhodospiraceae bacterium]